MNMKLFFIFSILPFFSFTQFYQYNGKVSTLNVGYHPYSKMRANNTDRMFQSVSLEYSRMVRKGIFPTVSLSYLQKNTSANDSRFNNGLVIGSSILLQKRILEPRKYRRSEFACILQMFGLLIAPEYNYMLTDRNSNLSNGELAFKMGMYTFTSFKKSPSKSFLWTVYYRKGLTPIYSSNNLGNEENYFRSEFGLQLRVFFRGRYDFLE